MSWKLLDIFYQTFNIGPFWEKDECFKFWGQKVKVQGRDRSNMLENARLAFLAWYHANYWTEFHQTFSYDAFWDKDERVNVWRQ